MDDWGAPGVAMENSTRHGRRTAFIGPGDDVADAQADPGVRDLLRQMGGGTLAYTSGDRLVVRKRLPFPSRTLRRARWHETKPGVWGHHDSDYTAVVEGPRIYLTTGMVEGLAEAQFNPGARGLGIEAKVGRKTYDVALERNYTLGFYPKRGGRTLYTTIDDSMDRRGNIWLGLGVVAGPRGNIAGIEKEAKVQNPERFKKELVRALRRYGVKIPTFERGKYKRIGPRGQVLGDEPDPAAGGRPAGWPAPPPSKPLPTPPRDPEPDLTVTTDDGRTTYGVYYKGGGDFELRTKTGARWIGRIGRRNPDTYNVRDLPTSGGWNPPQDKHMPRELPQTEVQRIRQGARQRRESWGAPGARLTERDYGASEAVPRVVVQNIGQPIREATLRVRTYEVAPDGDEHHVLTHEFHGKDREQAVGFSQSHMETDEFYAATGPDGPGTLEFEGRTLHLRADAEWVGDESWGAPGPDKRPLRLEARTVPDAPKPGVWVFRKRAQLGWGEDFKPGDTIMVRETYNDTDWRGDPVVRVSYSLGDGTGNAITIARWKELVNRGAIQFRGGMLA